ncbi:MULTISPECIES: 5-oxoprolinase subunit PxpA [Arenibacter]|uniref:5-oxoprolinase subunit PxpA n=1 Tax=Arenibacter TaxID=178469 RepID=UPI000A361C50|nr:MULTISPECIES: 5-oxoprolinase subunit PxpA [Arenibacter]
MTVYTIDINCDLGEGANNEAQIMPYISSCNIACGGHAGDVQTMKMVADLAKEHKVLVGAHPSYPDKENFGRVSIELPEQELINSIKSQISTLARVLAELQIPLDHIKPHGALYNDAAIEERVANIFLLAIEEYKEEVVLYAPYRSVMGELALVKGFKVKYEGFMDRNYNPDGSLVGRKHPNAMIDDPKAVLQHLSYMVKEKAVKTIDGSSIKLMADTYCIHGDEAATLQILAYLSQELPKHKIFTKH